MLVVAQPLPKIWARSLLYFVVQSVLEVGMLVGVLEMPVYDVVEIHSGVRAGMLAEVGVDAQFVGE